MSVFFFYSMVFVYGIHVLIDILCTIVTIMDPYVYNMFVDESNLEPTTSSTMYDVNEQGEEHVLPPAPKLGSNPWMYSIFKGCLCKGQWYWKTLLGLYPFLFREEYIAGLAPHVQKTQIRIFMYWIAAMSIVRFCAILFLAMPLFLTMSLIYFMEFLVFQYEGSVVHVLIEPSKAKTMSMLSAGMSFFSVLLCIWV